MQDAENEHSVDVRVEAKIAIGETVEGEGEGGLMIRLAVPGDIPLLKALWKRCFGDDDEYIDLFFTQRFSPDTVMVYDEGSIRAMLSMLPLTLRTSSKGEFPAVYIYAVATHPDFQHKGICGRLLTHTHNFLRSRGVALSVLVPSSAELFSYYRRYAFDKQLDICEQRYSVETRSATPVAPTAPAPPTSPVLFAPPAFPASPVAPASPVMSGSLTPLSAQEFTQMRREYLLAQKSCFLWDETALAFQRQISNISGGVFYAKITFPTGIRINPSMNSVGSVGSMGSAGSAGSAGSMNSIDGAGQEDSRNTVDLTHSSGYIVAEKSANTLYLKETSFPTPLLEAVAQYALHTLGGNSCVVRTPAAEFSDGNRPFALASCYKEIDGLSGAYLNLVLD